MNRTQKIAVFNLVVFGTSLLLAAIAVTVLYLLFGWPRANVGLAFIGFSGIAGFSPIIFRKQKDVIDVDERDKLINRTAAFGGFAASYLWFCITGTAFVNLMEPIFLKKFGLPVMIFGGMYVVFIVHSVLILVQYGRRKDHE